MTRLRFAAVLAAAAALAALAGCAQTGTVIGAGELDRAVTLIGVPGSLQVINQVAERDSAGDIVRAEAQIRNLSNSKKARNLEYQVKFFSAPDGREIPSSANGWIFLTIGRGEIATLRGATTLPGAARACITVREWNRNE